MREKLIKNAIKCNRCGDVIESKHRHDFKRCKCGTVFVDGGLDYSRRGYEKPEDFTDLCEWEEIDED